MARFNLSLDGRHTSNPNPPFGFVNDVRDTDVFKNQLRRVLEVVNGALNAVSKVCKLGLNFLKFTLQSLDSLCVCHKRRWCRIIRHLGSGIVFGTSLSVRIDLFLDVFQE
jgi:hypothetical protein